jgi:hypothetical protein
VKLTLHTNVNGADDWRELTTESLGGIEHADHEIPERVWLKLLRAAGVQVDVIDDDFGEGE